MKDCSCDETGLCEFHSRKLNLHIKEIIVVLAILGKHFMKCKKCKKYYFENMEKITMRVIKHIKQSQTNIKGEKLE